MRASALIAVACACGSAPATQDAGGDASTGAFPGCAPARSEEPPVCTQDHFCWVSPTDRAIRSVSGGGCDYWLAGDAVYRMNGDALTAVPGVGAANAVQVFPTEAWAVGGATMRFDGTQWTTVDDRTAYRIWGTGPDDVWVRRPQDVAHWDGQAMTSMRVLASTTSLALWGTSATDVRVVDGAEVAHWNGSAWTTEALDVERVVELWGAAPDDWYAVTEEHAGGSGIWHFDGAVWTRVHATTQPLHAIWGSAADDVWVGGDRIALHGSGTSWSPIAVPEGMTVLAIHGTSREDVVLAGADVVARWDGSRIVEVAASLRLAPGETRWAGMYGASASDVWAVADLGTLAHWDGTSWRASRIPDELTATAIGGAQGEVWVAGERAGTMHVWRRAAGAGDAWQPTDLGVPGSLHALHAATATDAWAVGDGGAIFHFDGTSWRPSPSPTSDQLAGVWGSSGDAWAAGGGTLAHWNGSVWNEVHFGFAGPYTAVWGLAANDVYFGDSFGDIVHFDGEGFDVQQLAPGYPIFALGGTASTHWATSQSRIALDRGTGTYVLATPNATWYAGYFPSRSDGWIAGSGGALMRYQP